MGSIVPTINIYDENNKSGLGKEIIAEIEVEFKYRYNHGYPDTYMEPGMEDEVEIDEVSPVSVLIDPIDIPESRDSLLFTQLVNIFKEGTHESIKFEKLDEERKRTLIDFCQDYEKEMIDAAFEDYRSLGYED